MNWGADVFSAGTGKQCDPLTQLYTRIIYKLRFWITFLKEFRLE